MHAVASQGCMGHRVVKMPDLQKLENDIPEQFCGCKTLNLLNLSKVSAVV